MKKPNVRAEKQLAIAANPEGPIAGDYPSLTEFLTALVWEGGEKREPGSLLICAQDGRWRGWLNDRAFHRSCWLSSESLAGLLEALEAGLRGDCLEWRADRPKGGPRGR